MEARHEAGDTSAVSLDMVRARLAALLHELVAQGVLERQKVAARIDAPLLGKLGMVDPSLFQRRGIQIRTATFFKQPKYNLLREENQGYASLFMSLESCVGPSLVVDDLGRVREDESAAERDARAAGWLTTMTSLVGAYNLDPARALDVALTLFCSHVVHHYPFFLSLFRQASPTWDSERITEILGFQYAHYVHPDTRESAPEELYLLTALLIRERIVSLAQMMAYVASDDAMRQLRHAYEEALTTKTASVGANALTMAAPLVDDDAPTSSPNVSASSSAPDRAASASPAAHGVHGIKLVRAMLRCGALDEVRAFIAAHPWIFGAYPSLTHAYVRLVWRRLDTPAFRRIAVLCHVPTRAQRTSTLTMFAPEPRATRTHQFVFCVGDWADAHPPFEHAEDVLPLLAPLGVYVCQDRRLLQLLCRVCANATNKTPWMHFLRTQLMPAITLADGGAPVLYELWRVLQTLPYTERYSLYGEWKQRSGKRPELRFAKMQTEREARGILRRISSDNVRASGRSFAKAAHAHPTVFFDVVLHQIQSYDNLIEPVVDAAKYLTPLEYDVFSYALLDALSQPAKERTKSDGTNASLWLKSLASFAGAFYRKYVSMDCTPLLQYLANRLKQDNVTDLIVLSELVLKMSGIEPAGELSESQMAALSGGPLLQTEAAMTLMPGSTPAAVLLARNSFKKGALRLYRMLVQLSLIHI